MKMFLLRLDILEQTPKEEEETSSSAGKKSLHGKE
jgi:hypothetical protein